MMTGSAPEVKTIQDNIITRFMDNEAVMQEIDFATWVLHSVYGWSPEKIRKMSMKSMIKWMKFAKKRMTVGNWMAVNTYFKPREVKKSLWKKLFKKS